LPVVLNILILPVVLYGFLIPTHSSTFLWLMQLLYYHSSLNFTIFHAL
jgi:hypothetical protein